MCEYFSWRKFTQIMVGLSLCFLTSCTYDPDDRYWVDLKSPSAPEVNIDFNINSDTVYFNNNVPVVLKINASNENIIVGSTTLYIDNDPVNYTIENGAFVINPFELMAGIHKFRIEFLANSGTNSIADKVGAEMYQFKSRELIFVVKATDQSRWIKESESADGLTLTWNPGLVFNSYELRKVITIRNNMGHFLLDTVYRTDVNTFTDTHYIGESAHYKIYGVNTDGKSYLLGTWSTSCKLPKLKVIEYQNKIALVWPKTVHFNHVKKIELISKSIPDSPAIIASLKNTDTLFFLDRSYFGQRPSLTLRFTPEIKTNENTILCFESYYFTDQISLPGPDLGYVLGSSCSDLFYNNDDTLFGYSAITHKLSLAQPGGFVISPDGNYSLQNINNRLYYYSLSPYSLIRSTGVINEFTFGYSISNNGMVLFNTRDGLEIYDFSVSNLHISNTKYSYSKGGYWAEFSPDGNYLKMTKESYPDPVKVVFAKIQGNNIVPVDSLTGCICRFYKTDPTLFYYYKNSTLTIKKIEDLSTVRTIYTGDDRFGNIDFCTNRMITKGKDFFHVYDIVTGELLFTIPMQNGYYFHLLKNIVFFDYGNKYFLTN